MTKEELSLHIEYFVEEGADMIDIGIPVEIDLERAIQTIKWAVNVSPVPVSIDTLNSRIIEKAIPEGVDLILSVSRDSLGLIPLISKYDVAIVVIGKTGLRDLISTISVLRREGIEKIIADPILNPPGFGLSKSICRYRKFRELNPNIPTLMGVGNVSELIDADSQGVNALVASLAIELGASILLTTEHSPKTTGCVKELKTASVMAAVSKYRNTPPKDLGVDLLIIKEKFKRPEGDMPKKFIKARNSIRFKRDPLGDFRIWISNGKIVVSHKKAIIVGDDAKSIISTILEMGLISSLQHASYLGRELMKAELAVRFNRSYMQDDVF
jgi:dihydropteroate synthase-like protein